ncbi:glycosyltransferase family A protein [Microbacterium elymi]|uniref:Glycosyltransferase family 2 protein n=1 Tax=Microbacterium elymi TaxID=2909587 RepID=A0ABY5NKZ5_9MICO|nr:glycosyltransferase family A protein [Microbacterium elymi]UUT35741.1 glycosyltransferase family 2 protein [Microbacterium elymi]
MRKRRGRYELEFIFVDDGSPDDSAQIAERWLDAAARSGRVIRKANGGVSSARNAGIAVAAGDWIALPDGDDFVGDRYFAATADALLAPDSKDAVIAAANVKWFSEAAGRATDTHALKFKFADGTRVIDLDREPQAVQSQAASAFFRRDMLQRDDVRFIESLSIAEDALFVAEYLLAAPSRRVLMVSDAEYFYRKRTAADSAVDNSGHNPDFNFGRFERGYLPLFERAESDGNVPAWLDMMFLYDVRWFLPRENDISKKATWMSDADRERVLAALAAVLAHVADSSIHSYNVTSLGVDHRCLLLALKGSPLPAEGIAKVVTDDHRGVEIRYLFARALPVERFAHDGRPVEPVVSKTRRLDVFGQTLVRERILWFAPRSVVTVQLDDHAVALESSVYQARGLRPRPRQRRASSATRAQAARFLRRVAGRARAELACAGARVVPIQSAGAGTRRRDARPPLDQDAATPRDEQEVLRRLGPHGSGERGGRQRGVPLPSPASA